MNDVVIVGAGPAGSSLALLLARQGVTVTLLERQTFPRNKVCGEYLSSAALQALRDLDLQHCVDDAYPIRGIALAAYGSAPLRLRLRGDGACALPRATLDDRLLRAALQAGVRLCRGGYMDNAPESGGVHVTYRDAHGAAQSMHARVLVGADGAWSAVARRNGLAPNGKPRGRWAVGGHMTQQPRSDELEMFIGPGGYLARNPLSADSVNTMLVMPTPTSPEQTQGVAAALSGGLRTFDESALQRRVAVGPLRYSARGIVTGRILLTGDAAGLLDPFTGQGVACALRMSFPAGRAVGAMLANRSPSAVAYEYARTWRSIIAPRRALSQLLDAVIRTPWLRVRADRAVRRDQRVAEQILAAVSGATPVASAFSPRLLWSLLAS